MNTGAILKTSVTAVLALVVLFGIGWCFYRSLKNSDDPARLVFKWILTVGVLIFMWLVVVPLMRGGGYEAAFGGVPLAAVCGLVLAIIWRHSLTGLIANPFGSLYDGGGEKFEVRAFYSAAKKFRQRNQFHEAIIEIRKQLEKFPNDFHGQILLAEINAENLQDLQSADIIIQKIISQPGHTPAQIVGALHALADWHMKLAQDPDSSRRVLEQIIERFPDTQLSQMASQRIAHLGSVDSLLANHERPTIALKHFDPYAKLPDTPQKSMKPIKHDPSAEAALCLKHLEKFPLDTEAREKLAAIYAHDFQRIDLAASEVEQLITRANQRPREVARWLNLLADWQIKVGRDVSAADKTIRRIAELFPKTAYADQATLRLEYLRLQAKGNESREGVKLGSYEKDMGLHKPTIGTQSGF